MRSRWALGAGLLLLPALMLARAPLANAQECANACGSSKECTVDGLQNVATGDAELSIDAQCDLVVGNVGATGLDGVVQQGLASFVMATELASPNFSLSLTGTQATIRQLGMVGGLPDQEIMLTTFTNFNDDEVRLVVSCAEIDVKSYLVRVFQGRTLVGERELGVDPPIMRFPKGDLERIECGIWTNGDVYTEIRFGGSVPFSFDNPGADAGPLIGDRLFVAALLPDERPTLQSAIENVFVNTGPVTMTSFFVSDPPLCDPACATLRGKNVFVVKGEKRQRSPLVLDLALDQAAGTWATSDSNGDKLSGPMAPLGSTGRKFDLELGPEASAALAEALSDQASELTGANETLRERENTKIRARFRKQEGARFKARVPLEGTAKARYKLKAKGDQSP